MTGNQNKGALEQALQNNAEPQFDYAQYEVLAHAHEGADQGQVNIMIGSNDREFFPETKKVLKKPAPKAEI